MGRQKRMTACRANALSAKGWDLIEQVLKQRSPHPMVTSSYDDPPNSAKSHIANITVRDDRSYAKQQPTLTMAMAMP